LFHARRPATANDRSPNDDIVRGTATVLNAADLRPALAVAAVDVVNKIHKVGRCVAVQAAVVHHTQLVLDALLDRKPMTVAQKRGCVFTTR